MTTNQILIGVGLILVLAVGAQVLASRLRIPAIIVLLPAGFIAGPRPDVRPSASSGSSGVRANGRAGRWMVRARLPRETGGPGQA